MRCIFAVVVTVCAGCVTTSHTGSFVQDVAVAGDTLVVTSCDVTVTVARDLNSKSQTSQNGPCSFERYRLPSDVDAMLAVPEGCEASVERWQRIATMAQTWSRSGREQLWQSFPRTCRAYLEENLR